MFCKNCGKELLPGQKFCPACGQKVNTSVESQEEKTVKTAGDIEKSVSGKHGRNHKKPSKSVYVGIAGAVAVMIAGGVIFSKMADDTNTASSDSTVMQAEVPENDAANSDASESVPADNAESENGSADSAESENGSADNAELENDSAGSTGSDNAAPENTNEFNKEDYEDLPFTEEQIEELEDIYNTSYEDEKSALKYYIPAYIESYDEYGNIKEAFQELSGVTENFLDAVNEYDPNLKNIVAEDAGTRFGNSPLESYFIEKGVSAVLSDSEFGKEVRSMMENVVLGTAESLFIWALDSGKEDAIRKDAMIPVDAEGDYALVRSYGSIGGMLDQLEINSGYSIAKQALEERLEIIENEYSLMPDDFWSEDIEETFNAYKISENYQGRRNALSQEIEEWDEAAYQWKSDFLTRIGITDVDAILQNDENTEYAQEMMSKFVYSIVDKEGKVYSSFLVANDSLGGTINADGMCSVWNGSMYGGFDKLSDERIPHVIMDKEGNILFENDTEDGEGSIFYEVTPSGNVLKKTFKSDFDHGDYQVLEFVKPDGTSKKLMEGEYIYLEKKVVGVKPGYRAKNYCTDYYAYTCGYSDDSSSETTGVIDMSTGKLLTNNEYEELERTELKKIAGTEGKMDDFGIEVENNPEGIRMNEDYVICGDSVYDNSGKIVKELDQGRGVKDILYGSSRYWIVTESGYYYVLDENFSEILEPVKLPDQDSYTMTEYGVLVTESREDEDGYGVNVLYLYDESGEATELFEVSSDLYVNGFMAHCEDWSGQAHTAGVNLYSKETVMLSTPEIPISLTLQ